MKKKYDYFIYYFPLFAFLFIGMGSILLSVSLSSCSSSVKNPLLLCADSLMEVSPDSALSILESISSPQKLSRADRALYALLLTQARHKNYVPLDDDSLIKTAVDYYGDRDKSLRAAQAHYYWGATYRDMGRTSFAVEEYLKAIRLMPEQNEFLAMIYDNLAECYEEEDLDDVAMEAYRKAYQILKGGSEQAYPLRGIANVYFSQSDRDSALCYYQKALDYALVVQDSNLIGPLYHDLAMVYYEEEDYIQADKYISKAIIALGQDRSANACLLKAKIMFNLNELDSASYYFSKDIDLFDIYGKAVCYDGMYQVAKKREEWRTAMENMDAYKTFYDSIQVLTDNEELKRLMDKHQIEEHKMSKLRKQQLKLCISMFQSTDCYNKLETFEKSTPKQLLAMRGLRVDMRIAICEAFVDVMVNLKECCPSLTNDDLFYCILSSLHCSETVIMELMNTTSDALKTRKNRIKNKMGTYLFEQVFNIDNL